MSANSFEELVQHTGHNVEIVTYGQEIAQNVAVECEDCHEVLFDYDNEGIPKPVPAQEVIDKFYSNEKFFEGENQ